MSDLMRQDATAAVVIQMVLDGLDSEHSATRRKSGALGGVAERAGLCTRSLRCRYLDGRAREGTGVKGVGPAFIERHGKAVLGLVAGS